MNKRVLSLTGWMLVNFYVVIFATILTIVTLLSQMAYLQNYDLLKYALDEWSFSFVTIGLQYAPVLYLSNIVLLLCLVLGFDATKFKKCFALRKKKNESQ